MIEKGVRERRCWTDMPSLAGWKPVATLLGKGRIL